MDATRFRRIKSTVHQQWYARWRLIRFASHLGFLEPEPVSAAACATADRPTLAREVRCWKSRTGLDTLS